ncbi:MotE family protein [Yoonia sp. 2307UL14-13]|uniref:MotE family protein n=1 Tax=Yoonia sp. 2307UL14-13 TaxID=3126506 RepID=UPI0030A9B135
MARLHHRSGSTLYAICGLLLASAIIRVSAEVAPAFAAPVDIQERTADTRDDDRRATGALLAALQEREARVAEREMQLQDRMQALELAENEIAGKLAELVAAEQTLSATISQAERAAATDLDRLTRVYENMKPREAAALFAEMPPEFAAGFLGLMRPDAAAAIMTQLPPEKAFSFSVVLAGRNANTPTE